MANQRLILSEDQIQETVIDGLRAMGYIVKCTTNRAKKCKVCGTYGHSGYGADKGVPDLLITKPKWPKWMWCGLELKKQGGTLSPAQKELHLMERIVIVRSWEDALKAVKEFENGIK